MLIDIDDGFGGLAIRTLENLQDCYGQKSVAIYGSWPGIPNKDIDENTQLINSALTVGHITQHNSLFVPLSLQEKYFGKENVTRKFQHLSYKVIIIFKFLCIFIVNHLSIPHFSEFTLRN